MRHHPVCRSHTQELFLRSSQPKDALAMRKDLKHW